MSHQKNYSAGFTLIEVLVTLSIVALAFSALTGFAYVQIRQASVTTRVLNEIATIEAIDSAISIAHGGMSQLATRRLGQTFQLDDDRLVMLASSPQILDGPSIRFVTWLIERNSNRGTALIYRWREDARQQEDVILADNLTSAAFSIVASGSHGPKAVRLELDFGNGRSLVNFIFTDQTVRWSLQP